MNRYLRRATPVTGLAIAAIVVAACGHVAKIDKAGAVPAAPTIIRLESLAEDPDAVFFTQDVTALGHGKLKVVLDSTTYPSALPANEARLVAAMRTGKAGFSYEPAHDWAAVGVAGFVALDAPFLITTAEASERLAHSSLAAKLLASLKPLGMVGVGLIPNEPRHILSARPLFTAAAFHGLRIRIVDNPQTAAFITALGGSPVQGDSSTEAGEALIAGTVDGLETSSAFVLSNSYNAEAPYFTSFALLSRFDVITATKAAWAALTSVQQAAMRQAAADTLAHSAQVAITESSEISQICHSGIVLDQPTQAQLNSLVAASRPAMPAGGAAAALARAIAASVPGSGATPSDIPTPAGCDVAHTAAQAGSLHRGLTPAAPTKPVMAATIPTGVYVTTDSVADLQAAGVDNPNLEQPVTYTTYLKPNGEVIGYSKPDNDHQGPARGTYVVRGDVITFYWNRATGLTPESLHWSYFDGQLTFKLIHVQDQAGHALYLAHPWRKIG